jgi:hypothetical protein
MSWNGPPHLGMVERHYLALNKELSREKLWQDLLNANKDFVIAASSLSPYGSDSDAKGGIALKHAYSVLSATEETDEDRKNVRLVIIRRANSSQSSLNAPSTQCRTHELVGPIISRNPWGTTNHTGNGEWSGPWCDGCKGVDAVLDAKAQVPLW